MGRVEFLPEMMKNKVPDKAARHRINRQVPSVPRPTSCLHVCREIVPQASLPVDLCRFHFGRQCVLHPVSSLAHGAMPWRISALSVIAAKSIAPKAAPNWPEPLCARLSLQNTSRQSRAAESTQCVKAPTSGARRRGCKTVQSKKN
jgi:hypothetical protein